ncbi:MAG: epoxyqueuosine reductase QueH [Thermodesulfobacteriota bacterium]
MSIVLHVCCGPCTAYPLKKLRQEGIEPWGFFFNPNVHPFREFKRRLQALEEFSQLTDFQVKIVRDYGMREYLRQVVHQEEKRCLLCYEMRLSRTVEYAVEQRAEAFSSTLLYSRYQNHKLLRDVADDLAARYKVPFYYEDFREGWQEGIDMSLEMGLYRQPYCGCIYSEQERYDKKFRKKKRQIMK